MNDARQRALRALPAVSSLLADTHIAECALGVPEHVVTGIVRRHIDDARSRILNGEHDAAASLADEVCDELEVVMRGGNAVVINGSGVIVQTNLGRAPVSNETAEAMRLAATSYIALETDLETGERGGRGAAVETLMRALTGAPRTLAVNNNAAAVLLVLSALAQGREVVVSRGEAVEIGGGFRIPAVLRQSGASLVEVGTTNRTYVSDYESAVTEHTAAFLRVHASNFSIVGFTAKVELGDLVRVARHHNVLAIEDVGSGCLLPTERFGLAHEPTLAESITAGVDVVCASGDKLLGGPQAGIIMGRTDLIERIERHPLARAVRADKTCLAGLTATLRHYLVEDALDRIPVWWSISRDIEWLRQRVEGWHRQIADARLQIVDTEAVVGGGSLPGRTLRSVALGIDIGARGATSLARDLRTGRVPVVPRVSENAVLIDARTVLPDQDELLIDAIRSAIGN